jgi:hypothetical protein
MNVVVLVGVAAVGICALWVAQTVALIYVGERLALPLQYTTRSPVVRMTSQVMIQAVWIIIVVGTPIALGINTLCAATSLSTTGSLAPDCDCLPHHVHSVVPWLCALHQGAMAALRAEARRRDPAKEAVFAVFDAGAFGCA